MTEINQWWAESEQDNSHLLYKNLEGKYYEAFCGLTIVPKIQDSRQYTYTNEVLPYRCSTCPDNAKLIEQQLFNERLKIIRKYDMLETFGSETWRSQ